MSKYGKCCRWIDTIKFKIDIEKSPQEKSMKLDK